MHFHQYLFSIFSNKCYFSTIKLHFFLLIIKIILFPLLFLSFCYRLFVILFPNYFVFIKVYNNHLFFVFRTLISILKYLTKLINFLCFIYFYLLISIIVNFIIYFLFIVTITIMDFRLFIFIIIIFNPLYLTVCFILIIIVSIINHLIYGFYYYILCCY